MYLMSFVLSGKRVFLLYSEDDNKELLTCIVSRDIQVKILLVFEFPRPQLYRCLTKLYCIAVGFMPLFVNMERTIFKSVQVNISN